MFQAVWARCKPIVLYTPPPRPAAPCSKPRGTKLSRRRERVPEDRSLRLEQMRRSRPWRAFNTLSRRVSPRSPNRPLHRSCPGRAVGNTEPSPREMPLESTAVHSSVGWAVTSQYPAQCVPAWGQKNPCIRETEGRRVEARKIQVGNSPGMRLMTFSSPECSFLKNPLSRSSLHR